MNFLQTPLPNQIPEPVEIPQSLSDATKSATVDALIAQNEDLMARLAVTLRRNLILEENLEECERALKDANDSYERVCDQSLILQRKDELWQQKLRAESEKLVPLKQEIQLLKFKSEESESLLKSNTNKFRQKIDHCHRALVRFRKYHLKIQQLVRPKLKLQNQLLQQVSESKKRSLDLQSTITRLTGHLQHQRTKFQQTLKDIESQYQSQILDISKRLDALKQENLQNKNLQNKNDTLMMERGEFENKAITLARKYDVLQTTLNRDIETLQGEVTFYRTESKRNESELNELRYNVKILEEEKDTLRQISKDLSEHLESLQILWQEKQKEFEQLQLQKSALQKLNLELSTELRRLREASLEMTKPHLPTSPTNHQVITKLIAEIESGY